MLCFSRLFVIPRAVRVSQNPQTITNISIPPICLLECIFIFHSRGENKLHIYLAEVILCCSGLTVTLDRAKLVLRAQLLFASYVIQVKHENDKQGDMRFYLYLMLNDHTL